MAGNRSTTVKPRWYTTAITHSVSARSRAKQQPYQPTQLTVHLLTPTRITHKGQITDQLPFHLFWRRLIGRISALGYFHCGESLDLDFKGLIAQAETVQTVGSKLRWHDWTRYSSRQNQKMQLGGLDWQRDICRVIWGCSSHS